MMDNSKLKNEQTQLLANAILALENKDECFALFEDLCTIREIQDLAQRIQVAQLLRQHITYHEIASITGASTATISRVNRALTYGAGGYDTILARIVPESETAEKGSI